MINNEINVRSTTHSKVSKTKKVAQVFFVGLLLQLGLSSTTYAGTGGFTQYDASFSNWFSGPGRDKFKVAIRPPLTSCGAEARLPYIVIFIGGTGNFIGNPEVQSEYYEGAATTIAERAAKECVRTVIVETNKPYWKYYENGSSDDPIGTGANYIYDILVSLQAHPHLANAPRWYLMGGSAGSLMSVKLLDRYFEADKRSTWLKLPAAVILESLPSSGSLSIDCSKTGGSRSGFETNLELIFAANSDHTTCHKIRTNSAYYRSNPVYKFLNGRGIKDYMKKGKKIFIMQGDNDPLFKESLTKVSQNKKYISKRPGWTMVGVLKNFASVAGLAATCNRIDGGIDSGVDDVTISNTYKTWGCYSHKLFARTYPSTGHGPISNSDFAADNLGWIIGVWAR